MANHEKNFRYYYLYHIIYKERPIDGVNHPAQHEYYSARGRKKAVERFRKSYPYEKYMIMEVAHVLSFKDLKEGE